MLTPMFDNFAALNLPVLLLFSVHLKISHFHAESFLHVINFHELQKSIVHLDEDKKSMKSPKLY